MIFVVPFFPGRRLRPCSRGVACFSLLLPFKFTTTDAVKERFTSYITVVLM